MPLLFAVLLAGCEAASPVTPAPAECDAVTSSLHQRVKVTNTNFVFDADTDVVIVERGAVEVTLPPLSQAGAGRTVTIRCLEHCAQVLIQRASNRDLIEDVQRLSLTRQSAVTLVSDGRNRWVRISESRF